jgi:hypothetical protein
MKKVFTLHAGEYLTGSHIQNKFRQVNIWVPANDTGIDLLVSDRDNRSFVSLQVKFSTDYRVAPLQRQSPVFQEKLKACGWWTLTDSKITKPHADYWVLVLQGFDSATVDYVVIPPQELAQKLRSIHGGNPKHWQVYMWVTKTGLCWETRDLKKAERIQVAKDEFVSDPNRDFKKYLNAWEPIERLEKA